jgi:heptose-I-phosphate ethanolaminephosphotransferase
VDWADVQEGDAGGMSALGHGLMNTLAPKLRRLWPGCLALAAISLAWVLAYDGKRIFQIGVLALPAVLCLCWPSRHAGWRSLQAGFVGTMGLAFITDAAVRGFLLDVYDASPASAMVITAVANTTPQEMKEFMAMNGLSVWLWGLFAFLSLSVFFVSLAQWWRTPPSPRKLAGWRLGVMLLVLTMVVVSMANKPWRQHQPLFFWTNWVAEVASLRDQWDNLGEQRQRLLANAQAQNPRITAGAPDTLVLVISESINRGHLSLYGYPRNTTPALMQLEQTEGDRLGVFAHAWSVDASTVQALRNFFYFGHAQDQPQHLMALAAKAGYETWWISNHDDLAIDQEHAKLADRVHMLNKTPGRSGVSLDEGTLPHLAAALKSQAARKLIVVHLLGTHPHYALRHPATRTPFNNVKDDIYQALKDQGRSSRVRDLRNDYDSAIHYHDEVVAATLDMTRTLGNNAAWVYFSDHGQEVGHVGNHVGHSAATADGYRVPLLVWGAGIANLPPATFSQPVRTDWLGHSVMHLLGIDWLGHLPEKNVLDTRYRWRAPPLPMVADFAS